MMFFLNGFLTHHSFIEQEDKTRPSGATNTEQLLIEKWQIMVLKFYIVYNRKMTNYGFKVLHCLWKRNKLAKY